MRDGSRLAVLSVMAWIWGLTWASTVALPALAQDRARGDDPPPAMQRPMPPDNQELVGDRRDRPGAGTAAQPSADPRPGGVITIGFNNGSAQLTPTATRRLDVLGREVDGRSHIRVDGYAWGIGTRDAARDLARRRADAVIGYLQALGIGRDRLSGNASPETALPALGVRVTVLYPMIGGRKQSFSEEKDQKTFDY